MEFHLFDWFSVVLCFLLQLVCFLKLKEPKSLRLLMLTLCAGNVLSVLSHNYPEFYYYQLHIRRMISCIVFLWAVGDAVSLPKKASWALRVPVVGALVLAGRYWPFLPENGPAEMEQFRMFALFLALFIVALHLVLLIPAYRPVNLVLSLLGCLAAEASGSYAMLHFGYFPRFQMFAWWAGMAFLVAVAARNSGLFHTEPHALPVPLPAVQAQSAGYESFPGELLRVPLQYRLPDERLAS